MLPGVPGRNVTEAAETRWALVVRHERGCRGDGVGAWLFRNVSPLLPLDTAGDAQPPSVLGSGKVDRKSTARSEPLGSLPAAWKWDGPVSC